MRPGLGRARAQEASGGGPDLRSRLRPGGWIINSSAWLRLRLQGARYLHAPPPGSLGSQGTPSPATDSGLTG